MADRDSPNINVGILTISDSCYNGSATDRSGENLKHLVETGKLIKGTVVTKDIIPDELDQIKAKLLHWSDHLKLDLILTTGGTGFAHRDVTPEATKAVLEKEAMGLTVAMLKGSLDITPMAMLTRLVCGSRGSTLIINLPGSTKGSSECFQIASVAIPHAVDLLRGHKYQVERTHSALQAEHNHSQHGHSHGHSQEKLHSLSGLPRSRHNSSGHQSSRLSPTALPHPPLLNDGDKGNNHHHHHRCHAHSHVNADQVALRSRESPYPIIPVKQAVSIVLESVPLLPVEPVEITCALGRYLAASVYAADPLPPFCASIKDGYAVKAEDGAGVRMVYGESSAGDVPEKTVTSGFCMRINTGAPVPNGADAVVQVEDTELVEASVDGKTEIQIRILKFPTVGQDIRPVGSDIEKGQEVLSVGQRLGPSELGLLATVGVTTVQCYSLPTVGVLSTGNELVEPNVPLTEGKIRDSNRTVLLAQLKELGVPSVDLGIARDSPDTLLQKLSDAMDIVDIVVTTGGVSMGDKDYLKQVLLVDLKAKIHFARVLMKPGKPTTFATLEHKGKTKIVFGLPGNPVSSIVTCHLYLVPAIRKMSGCPNPLGTVIKVKVDRDLILDPRPEYHRASLTWDADDATPTAHTTGNQISSRLLSMSCASVLMMLSASSPGASHIPKGALVDALVIGPV